MIELSNSPGTDVPAGNSEVATAMMPQAPLPNYGRSVVSRPPEVENLGPAAVYAFDEFFSGHLRNRHTRISYLRAVRRFLDWLRPSGLDLTQATPGLIGHYFDEHPGSIPSKKLALAALRAFFDCLVRRHVCILNPAASVRGERYSVVEGSTPEISAAQARQLLDSVTGTSPIDLRDRCIIGVLIFTAARAGAVARLQNRDLLRDSGSWSLRFIEKGGKRREIPVRLDLQKDLQSYFDVAFIVESAAESPLFPTAGGRTGLLSGNRMSTTDIGRMVKRHLVEAGLPTHLSSHSFRVGTITNLLSQGVPLEDVQYLAGHADPRTTRLYDRRSRQVTRNVVERISI